VQSARLGAEMGNHAVSLHQLTLTFVLEWAGEVMGLMVAFLVATHGKYARYGWAFFLASTLALITWAAKIGATGLLVLQVGSKVTSLIGLKQSGLIGISWLRKTGPPGS